MPLSVFEVNTLIGWFEDLHVPLREKWPVYWILSLFEHLQSSKVSSAHFHGNDNINRFRLRWHGIWAVACCSFDADGDGCLKSLVLNALLMSNRILIVPISTYISTSIYRSVLCDWTWWRFMDMSIDTTPIQISTCDNQCIEMYDLRGTKVSSNNYGGRMMFNCGVHLWNDWRFLCWHALRGTGYNEKENILHKREFLQHVTIAKYRPSARLTGNSLCLFSFFFHEKIFGSKCLCSLVKKPYGLVNCRYNFWNYLPLFIDF